MARERIHREANRREQVQIRFRVLEKNKDVLTEKLNQAGISTQSFFEKLVDGIVENKVAIAEIINLIEENEERNNKVG